MSLSVQNKALWTIGLTIHNAGESNYLAVWRMDSTVY